ncbi:MAG: DUF2029 domain-containing protein [Chloroflexi bacterium]|nr:DUF2029 domain-containing protein [Chloroflexota bacterium]
MPRLPLALLLIGSGLELGYLALWPLSYRLTHGVDYTYQYLVHYQSLWLKLHELLPWWDWALPGIDQSLEVNVNVLTATFALLFGLYLVAATLVYRARPGRGLAWLVLALALLFQVTLFFMPGVFTTDIFSYAMYGHIAGVYGLNPYLQLPGYFPGNPLLDWIHPIWRFAPSVYGPLWANLSSILSALVQDWEPVDRILAYKLLINLAHLVNLGLAWLLLRHFQPGTRVAGLLLFAWNPLLLFEFAGNGHNDALMLTFLLLAVLLFLRRRPGWGLVALALSVWVKYTTVLVVPLYLVIWARQYRSRAVQARVFVGGSLVVLLVALLLYLPWYGDGLRTLEPVFDWAKGPMYLNHPPEVIGNLLVDWGVVGGGLEPEEAQDLARDAIKWLTRGLFGLYLLYELRRARAARDLVPAAVRLFLVFLLTVHTWILTWYFSWPVALAVLLGLRHPLTRVLLGFTFTSLAIIYYQQFWDLHLDPGRTLLYLSPLLVPLVEAALRRRARLAKPRPLAVLDLPPPTHDGALEPAEPQPSARERSAGRVG